MLQKHKRKFLVAGVILLLLTAAFFLPDRLLGSTPEESQTAFSQVTVPSELPEEESERQPDTPQEKKPEETPTAPEKPDTPERPSQEPEQPKKPAAPERAEAPAVPVEPEIPSQPEEPAPEPAQPETFTVTLSVRCDTALQNRERLKPEKQAILPESGAIFTAREVTVNRGETVFQLLQREMKRAKIHLEFENTPLYQAAYIEGIGNLYERDCGEGSGWMYRVNGSFPGYGCSKYQLKEGDVVEWLYTCELGRDIGGVWAAGGN